MDELAILGIVGFIIWVLPSLIAGMRNTKYGWIIVVLNMVSATFPVLYVVALMWAIFGEKEVKEDEQNNTEHE